LIREILWEVGACGGGCRGVLRLGLVRVRELGSFCQGCGSMGWW